MKKLIIVVSLLLASTALAMSPKHRACVLKFEDWYNECRDKCELDTDHALKPCWAKCGEGLKERVDKCEAES